MIILPVKCNTYLEKGGHKMNEVFERLSDVFEELRSDAGEREYSIQTEEAKKADKELKKENREYEKFLSDLSTEQRNFLEKYMDIVDHAHFQEQQRAYYQGIVDAVQILAGLGGSAEPAVMNGIRLSLHAQVVVNALVAVDIHS